jgi:hypothetical protein
MSVSEAAKDGWDMTANDCNALFVGAGQTVDCYITNTQRGHLIVHKITDPVSDTTTPFSITADGTAPHTPPVPLVTGDPTQSITGGSQVDYEVAGNSTMSVSEAAKDGWDMTANDCNALFVGAGQTVDCYITNTQRGHVIVTKVTDPASDTTTPFSITADGSAPNTPPVPLVTGDPTQSITGGAQVDYEVAGNSTISVSEAPLEGWDMTDNSCSNLFVGAGQTVVCTITNVQRGKLIVTKHTDPASDTTTEFPVTASGTTTLINVPLITGDAARVLVGNLGSTTYEVAGYSTMSVVETVPDGWLQTDAVNCTDVFVAPGATVNCDIYNSAYGHVVVTKIVVNDNGGTNVSADFTMLVDGNQPTPASFPGSESGIEVDLLAGAYSISETGPSGYAASYSEGCSGAVAAGETKYCTITNDDIQPKLTVTKLVINDNGGTFGSADFTMLVNGAAASPASFAGDAAGTLVLLNAGAFSVSETGPAGYEAILGVDCAGTINIGETKSCIITNDDIAPRLIVTKIVVNNDGRTAVSGDFTMHVANNGVNVENFSGSNAGVEVVMDAGTYAVTESGPAGYQGSFGLGCSGTLGLGEIASCIVTNNDIPSGLVTSSSLCQYDFSAADPGNQFLLNFKKESSNRYSVVSTNPGQTYYNVIPDATGDITMTIPYPYVTVGGTPIHVYTQFQWVEESRCFIQDNSSAIYLGSDQITLATYGGDAFGLTTQITVPNVPAGAYLNIHLDYGLKGAGLYQKAGNNANSVAPNPRPSIPDLQGYTFSDSDGGTDSVSSKNNFNQ